MPGRRELLLDSRDLTDLVKELRGKLRSAVTYNRIRRSKDRVNPLKVAPGNVVCRTTLIARDRDNELR